MPSERPPAVDLGVLGKHLTQSAHLLDFDWYVETINEILADLEATRRERDEKDNLLTIANDHIHDYVGQYDELKKAQAEVAQLKAANGHLQQELAMARRRDGDG